MTEYAGWKIAVFAFLFVGLLIGGAWIEWIFAWILFVLIALAVVTFMVWLGRWATRR